MFNRLPRRKVASGECLADKLVAKTMRMVSSFFPNLLL